MKTLFIFLAVVMLGTGAMAQKFNSYPNTGTLQTGDLFIFSRGGNGTFNINALQLPGALGVQPTNSNLTDFAKWGTNSFFNVASNRAVSGLGTAAFTATTAYDAAGLALNATNGIGIASSLSAFRPTNTFDVAGAATAATNALAATLVSAANITNANQFIVTDSNTNPITTLNGASLTNLTGANVTGTLPLGTMPLQVVTNNDTRNLSLSGANTNTSSAGFIGSGTSLTNLIHGPTVTVASGGSVALSQNSDGSTNYALTVTGGAFTNTVLNNVWVATNGNDASALTFYSARGSRGSDLVPFLTLSNAIQAITNTGGQVNIGFGDFIAWPTNLLQNDHAHFLGTNKIVIKGSGWGEWDKDTNTLSVVGGTRIHSTVWIDYPGPIELRDFALDNGKTWCDANNGGTPADGILVHAWNNEWYTTNTLNRNTVIENVRCLAYTNNSAVHNIAFENTVDGRVENVALRYGQHGLALKGWNIKAHGITADGHSQDCIIVKITDFEAVARRVSILADASAVACGNVIISDVNMASLNSSGDTGGLYFDMTAGVGYILNVHATGLNCFGLAANRDVTFDNAISGGTLIGAQIFLTDGGGVGITKTGAAMSQVYVNGVSQ